MAPNPPNFAPEAVLAVLEAAVAVRDEWVGASVDLTQSANVEGLSDAGLVRVVDALAGLTRRVEAIQVRCAAEIAHRSRNSEGTVGLARANGHASAERLLQSATGGRFADAARLVTVGEATARRVAFGATVPPRRPRVAAALDGGLIGVDQASTITRILDEVSIGIDADRIDASERFLVERAPEIGVDGLVRLAKHLRAHLHPQRVPQHEAELRQQRTLAVWEDASGMIRLRGAFDPATAAPIKTAIDALVGAELHRARDARAGRTFLADAASTRDRARGVSSDGSASGGAQDAGDSHLDALFAEDRTIGQLHADALADLARAALGAAGAPPALRAATVVVRIDEAALTDGSGHATIDGIDQPVSVDTARRFAESAGLARMRACGSQVLDLGRSTRLFTTAQKIALAERDGGCAFPACHRPPSHTQAHHISWWTRDCGRTDLENGILLCSHHHHRVHDDGWTIRIRHHRSWFIPPTHLDPTRAPRPGNTAARHQIVDALARAG